MSKAGTAITADHNEARAGSSFSFALQIGQM
jgi:hypothetical protein